MPVHLDRETFLSAVALRARGERAAAARLGEEDGAAERVKVPVQVGLNTARTMREQDAGQHSELEQWAVSLVQYLHSNHCTELANVGAVIAGWMEMHGALIPWNMEPGKAYISQNLEHNLAIAVLGMLQ